MSNKTDPIMVRKIIGEKVKAARKRIKLTQTDLAERLSLTRTSVTNIETGKQNTTIEKLVEIADALNCDLRDLIPKIR